MSNRNYIVLELLKMEIEKTRKDLEALEASYSIMSRRLNPENNISDFSTFFSSEEVKRPYTSSKQNFQIFDYPIDLDETDQILFILKHEGKSLRLPTIDKIFKANNPARVDVRALCNKMRQSEIIISLKYDNNNQQVYYGLPEWLIESDSPSSEFDFQPSYRPIEVRKNASVIMNE